MKKIFSMILALMLVAALTACGGDGSSSGEPQTDNPSVDASASVDSGENVSDGDNVDWGEDFYTNSDAGSDPQEDLDQAVKSIMLYTPNGELFFMSCFDGLCPGLMMVNYNADGRIVGDIKVAFSSTIVDEDGNIIADEYQMPRVYDMLTLPDGAYVKCVKNVRYEGNCILADGIASQMSNHIGLFCFNNYDEALNDCNNNEYIEKYADGLYIDTEGMRVYFYDDVREMDLTELEKSYD